MPKFRCTPLQKSESKQRPPSARGIKSLHASKITLINAIVPYNQSWNRKRNKLTDPSNTNMFMRSVWHRSWGCSWSTWSRLWASPPSRWCLRPLVSAKAAAVTKCGKYVVQPPFSFNFLLKKKFKSFHIWSTSYSWKDLGSEGFIERVRWLDPSGACLLVSEKEQGRVGQEFRFH